MGCTGQAEGGLHAPEESAPPPTVGFRVNIDGLIQSPEVKLSLVVGKEIQQAKKMRKHARTNVTTNPPGDRQLQGCAGRKRGPRE